MTKLNVRDDVGDSTEADAAGGRRESMFSKAIQLSAVLTFGLLAVAQSANAAVLKINAADNPANTIQIEGPLSASVLHTAEGLEITIPGVQITLQCDSPTGDACTVVVGNGSQTTQTAAVDASSTGDAANPGSGGTSDSQGSADSDNSSGAADGGSSGGGSTGDGDSDPCASGQPVFGCGDAYGDGSSGDQTSDSDGSGTNDNSGSGTNGFDTSGSSDVEEDDPCATKGFSVDPACETSNDVAADSSTDFPNGSDRRVNNLSRLIDVGTAGNYSSGGTADVTIPQGEISVIGLTMMAEEYAKSEDGTATQNRIDPLRGSINFGPVGQVRGGALRLWISEKPDGIRVSEACSYGGYTEASIDISVDGSQKCDLRSGGAYYLNFALCDTDASDYNCSQTGARTASGRGVLVVEAKYR